MQPDVFSTNSIFQEKLSFNPADGHNLVFHSILSWKNVEHDCVSVCMSSVTKLALIVSLTTTQLN